MTRSLSYADAVRILGGAQSRTVALIERGTGGLLLAATAGGSGLAMSLFDAKSELAQATRTLVADLADRMSGLSRIDRTQRLAAGHAALVTSAYFDALASVQMPIAGEALETSGPERVLLATGDQPTGSRLGDLGKALLHSDVPTPAPHRPPEVLHEEVERFYRRLSASVERFLTGLVAWEVIGDADRQRVVSTLHSTVIDQALVDYQKNFRQVAVEVPEFRFWIDLLDHQATRERVGDVRVGVSALHEVLSLLSPQRIARVKRTALSRAYSEALNDPVLDAQSSAAGLTFPNIGSCYINPSFRVAAVTPQDPIADERWWEEVPARDDLMRYLVAHLTSASATTGPLLLLGQPGSGKSLLTRMLAATLPPEDFVVVRVPLRDVPADAPLQVQIEQAIFDATGERATWPEVVGAVPGGLPVVLLDGFDELLQATGVSQWDYLETVARFQHREAAEGRAAAFIVTTRTTVADRARPTADAVALRLEPFTDKQIMQWISIWNAVNEVYFRDADLQPLSLLSVVAHRELASQPLLLLMLAIYDAQDNALQAGTSAKLDQADLYERLLCRFARREVLKADQSYADSETEALVEEELFRLSMVASAAFNRGRQWVTEADLDTDLPILLNTGSSKPATSTNPRRALSVGQTVLGRFFFIHEARARREGQPLRTYEFLHATFGEYLIARALERELGDLAEDVIGQSRRSRITRTDDNFLYALLSFAVICQRKTTVDFLTQLLATWEQRRRDPIRTILLDLFRRAMEPREHNQLTDYAPVTLSVPARHATYSANLVLLLVASDAQVTSEDLFPDTDDKIDAWRRTAQLWRSQLRSDAWSRLVGTLGVQRAWDGEQRVVRLFKDSTWPDSRRAPSADLYWTRDILTADKNHPEFERGHFCWGEGSDALRQWQTNFLCDPVDDLTHHALEPLAASIDNAVIMVHGYWTDRAVSAAQSLITLWLQASTDCTPEALLDAFEVCAKIARFGFPPAEIAARRTYRIIFLRTLRANYQRLDRIKVAALRSRLSDDAGADDPADLAALLDGILGDIGEPSNGRVRATRNVGDDLSLP